ncbi:hypothetical protein C6P72_34120 [Burkholderia gladioli]|nr:hypothetical protein C6P72_34120 [Burkholderia gladioli]
MDAGRLDIIRCKFAAFSMPAADRKAARLPARHYDDRWIVAQAIEDGCFLAILAVGDLAGLPEPTV